MNHSILIINYFVVQNKRFLKDNALTRHNFQFNGILKEFIHKTQVLIIKVWKILIVAKT